MFSSVTYIKILLLNSTQSLKLITHTNLLKCYGQRKIFSEFHCYQPILHKTTVFTLPLHNIDFIAFYVLTFISGRIAETFFGLTRHKTVE